jgi:hypothetical protein
MAARTRSGVNGICVSLTPTASSIALAIAAATRMLTAEYHRMDVGAWLHSLGLERYVPAFRENDVDAEVLYVGLWTRPRSGAP